MKKLFITATDTDAGKTLIGSALTYLLTKQFKVSVFKPISAGCTWQEGRLVNEDAASLQHFANSKQTLSQINPIAFEEPIAPHIAAEKANQPILIDTIKQQYLQVLANNADIIITEGAGGWRLPLGNGRYLSQFAEQTQQAVILVVNMKLGCLNHAVLTYQAIIQDGLTCVGWVANCIDDMPYLSENLAELSKLITAPCLGKVPRVDGAEQAAKYLDIAPITSL